MPVQEGDGNWDEDEVLAPPSDPSPANVSTNSPGPQPSSSAPVDQTEPHPATDEELSGAEDPEPLPEFDPHYRDEFEGLLYLGKLNDDFNWLGHHYIIKTLNSGEILEIGLLHKPYIGTLAETKAYQAAVVAACVVMVDRKPIAVPVTNEVADTELLSKFNYVLRSWYPPLLDKVYEQYIMLEEKVAKILDAMGKASG